MAVKVPFIFFTTSSLTSGWSLIVTFSDNSDSKPPALLKCSAAWRLYIDGWGKWMDGWMGSWAKAKAREATDDCLSFWKFHQPFPRIVNLMKRQTCMQCFPDLLHARLARPCSFVRSLVCRHVPTLTCQGCFCCRFITDCLFSLRHSGNLILWIVTKNPNHPLSDPVAHFWVFKLKNWS